MENSKNQPNKPLLAEKSTLPKGIWLVIVVASALLLGLGVYFIGRETTGNDEITPVSPQSLPTPAPLLRDDTSYNPNSPPSSDTEVWKSYSDKTYTFTYPPTWKAQAGSKVGEEHYGGDMATITSPSPAVGIILSPTGTTYGFEGGASNHNDGKTLTVTINGRKYSDTEDIFTYTNSADKERRAFVDMTVPVGNKQFHVLYGTGYPATEDRFADYAEYQKYRPTILQILNTLQISN